MATDGIGTLLLVAIVGGAAAHGAVTNPVPRLHPTHPYCPWCVGAAVASNPPGQAHLDATLPLPCHGASQGTPYPQNRWGSYADIAGDPTWNTFAAGSSFEATVVLNADHNGFARWQYCPHNEAETEECFSQRPPLVDWTDVHAYWTDVESTREHERSHQHFPQTIPLPSDMPEGGATLRWHWVCRNTAEIFVSCIDVTIAAAGPPTPTVVPTMPASTTLAPTSSPVPAPPSVAPTPGPTGTCPVLGNGLPDDAASCGCGWTNGGADCPYMTDDASLCFCHCCCPHSGKCAYVNGGGGGSCTMPSGVTDSELDKDNTNFVACHGKLRVQGTQMVDESGNAVQLMGMSSHGLHWFPGCYSKASIQYQVEHWGINLFRAAMYVGEGGYASDTSVKEAVKNIVQWCKELGIYAMIDWHVLTPGNPSDSTYSAAIPFFQEMATLYKDENHVLYEIANEPNGVTWATVKAYADSVISAIRAIDASTIIIVGTPVWSQNIHEARADPVTNPANVMYAFHFYAGTHLSLLSRLQTEAALIPIFSTEWGTSEASGDGGPYLDNAKAFLDLYNDAAGQKISWVQWSYADKNEVSAALNPGACAAQAWDDTSCSGTFVKNYIKKYASTCPASSTTESPTVAPPTSAPTSTSSAAPTASPTYSPIACTDFPNSAMVRNNIQCATFRRVSECVKCKHDDGWVRNKWCQYSCYQAGCGYDGDVCSELIPVPTPSPTQPPTPAIEPTPPTPSPTSEPTAPRPQPTNEPTVAPTPRPTAAPSAPLVGGGGKCRNQQCGCPPFTGSPDWCNEESSHIHGEWCNWSPDQCSQCAHTWCYTRRLRGK